VRRFHLRDIVHEQEFREMVINAGALQVLAGAQMLAGRERLPASWTAARADHALHQSFQPAIDAVTSSKSVSDTPLATNRGPQWEMAEAISASVMAMVLWFKHGAQGG
jgi:hypothetical protein